MTIAILIAAYIFIGLMFHGYAKYRNYTVGCVIWVALLANIILAPVFIPLEIGKWIGFIARKV